VVGAPNTAVVMCYLGGEGGFPVPLAITTRAVQKAAELLYCYGVEY
jgi:hypothetical protein